MQCTKLPPFQEYQEDHPPVYLSTLTSFALNAFTFTTSTLIKLIYYENNFFKIIFKRLHRNLPKLTGAFNNIFLSQEQHMISDTRNVFSKSKVKISLIRFSRKSAAFVTEIYRKYFGNVYSLRSLYTLYFINHKRVNT